jgi:SAM-dependent methyltransferase
MKIAALATRLLERVMVLSGLGPTPMLDTFHAVVVARAIMVGTKIGVFEVSATRALDAPEMAMRVGAEPVALRKLLDLLVATGYMRYRDGRYEPSRIARRWLLGKSARSLHDNMLLRFLEWRAVESTEDFVRTGRSLDVHELIDGPDWGVYQRGMRSLARLSAEEVARRIRLPSDAALMLDIGGGHGAYSAAFCRRHPRLRATILDLAPAVEAAAPLLAGEGLGDRVVHRIGDAVADELGERAYDLVFVSHLVHHFDAATNEKLVRRAARALRPRGVLAVLDVLRPRSPETNSPTGAILDLYFAVTSNSGTWAREEIEAWYENAGLSRGKLLPLQTAPGVTVLTACRAPDPG